MGSGSHAMAATSGDSIEASADKGEVRATEEALRELMVRYQSGSAQAADELILALSPRLLRFLAGTHLESSEAEDLLQDCWIRIHGARHTYRPTEPLLPWIYAVARHTRLDAHRKRHRLKGKEVLMASVPDVTPARRQDFGVLQLLDQLPEAQREALWMLKVMGMSLEDVAQATATSVGAVKQRVHRGYARLRRLLEEKN